MVYEKAWAEILSHKDIRGARAVKRRDEPAKEKKQPDDESVVRISHRISKRSSKVYNILEEVVETRKFNEVKHIAESLIEKLSDEKVYLLLRYLLTS